MRCWLCGGTCLALPLLAIALVGSDQLATRDVAAAQAAEAPVFEVDPLWPKPLPNHWLLGSAVGVAVDASNHVYVIHRAQTNTSSNFSESFHRRNEIGAVQTP